MLENNGLELRGGMDYDRVEDVKNSLWETLKCLVLKVKPRDAKEERDYGTDYLNEEVKNTMIDCMEECILKVLLEFRPEMIEGHVTKEISEIADINEACKVIKEHEQQKRDIHAKNMAIYEKVIEPYCGNDKDRIEEMIQTLPQTGLLAFYLNKRLDALNKEH